MFTIACIFFGFGCFLSLETIKPKIIPENTMNAHLFGFRLNAIFSTLLKTYFEFLQMTIHVTT